MVVTDKEFKLLQADVAKFIARHSKSVEDLQTQVDAIDAKGQTHFGGSNYGRKTISDVLSLIAENPGFEQLRKSGRGRAIIEVPCLLGLGQKDTILSSSVGLPYSSDGGIGATGRKRYRVRELLRSLPIESGAAHYIRELSFSDSASPQSEGEAKAESSFTFEDSVAEVRTIATWVAASKQCLDDLVELQDHIETSLVASLEREFEEQLLNGDSTGSNLSGLITTATSFDTSLLEGSWEYVDILRLASLQLQQQGYECNAFVIPPAIKAAIDLQKNSLGDYLNRAPLSESTQEFLWGHQFVSSPSIGSSTFLAGDFAGGAHIRLRQESTVDLSDSHSDFFTKNKIAIRAEMRAALVVKRPGAFVTGIFTSSPA